jgi:DNA-binding transcriptional LysR family regulator
LGIGLVHRNSRILKLTAQGEVFYKRFADLELMLKSSIGSFTNSEQNEVTARVVLPNILSSMNITKRLPEFLVKYPNLKLIISHISKSHDFAKENVDIAITSRMPTSQNSKVKTLKKMTFKLFASQNYLDSCGVPATLEDLAQHHIVGLLEDQEQPQYNYKIIDERDESSQIFTLDSNIFMRSHQHSVELALTDKYMIIASEQILKSQTQLVPVLPHYVFHELSIFMARNGGDVENKVIVELARFLEERIKEI